MKSLLGFKLPAKASASADAFDHVMQIAEEVSRTGPSVLFQLITALLRPLQSAHLIAVAEHGPHGAPPSLEGHSFFFDLGRLINISSCWVRPTPPITIDLASDPVLPTAWDRRRFVSSLTTIGKGKAQGPWIQDPNHLVSLWLPWNIAFVNGGNHSITAGILGGEGVVTATEVIDASPVFNLVECDGRTYKRKQTGEVVAVVNDHRRAAVFEIGRLIWSLRSEMTSCSRS